MLSSGLDFRRRYSIQPTSPVYPMRLLPYPNGFAGPAFSFSASGMEKNFVASDSSWDMASMGTPWLMTLKNPNSSQAFTMRLFASGLDRSTRGMVTGGENAVALLLLQLLTWEYCSVVGLEQTTISFFFPWSLFGFFGDVKR